MAQMPQTTVRRQNEREWRVGGGIYVATCNEIPRMTSLLSTDGVRLVATATNYSMGDVSVSEVCRRVNVATFCVFLPLCTLFALLLMVGSREGTTCYGREDAFRPNACG